MAKKIPKRYCVGCRNMKEKRGLVRIVRTVDGNAALDLTGKANGRGAYVCPSEECLNKAYKSRAFDRALDIKVDEAVLEMLTSEVKKRVALSEAGDVK